MIRVLLAEDQGMVAAALAALLRLEDDLEVAVTVESGGEVLEAALHGSPVAEIAQRLSLTEGTVRNYLSVGMRKTGGRNRTEAARVARDNGWLSAGTAPDDTRP